MSRWYNEGYEDSQQQSDRAVNPHQHGTEPRREWNRGFIEGTIDAIKRLIRISYEEENEE